LGYYQAENTGLSLVYRKKYGGSEGSDVDDDG
jgi:hypothetical protein